ncbi:MAG: hypothetical protein KDA60_06595 [Planctomycetales bacterium]|nr:hypothetical protein [Planctomycetales bacterium]
MVKRILAARALLKVVGFAVMVLCLTQLVEACPTCKDSLAEGNNANMVRGYGWSIVFMMASPFVIFTALCAYFYYEVRKARAAMKKAAEHTETLVT